MKLFSVKHLPSFSWLHHSGMEKLFQVLGPKSLRCVGGCIRDSLLNLPVKDIDCATSWPADEVLRRLESNGIATYVKGQGLLHGSVGCVLDGRTYDITSLRRDTWTDGRHAHISLTSSWQEDHDRRDFKLNGLYLDAQGVVYDFDQGHSECCQGKISFIGNPSQRIQEDYLRILRFFRFFSLYGRLPLDQQALQACQQQAAGLAKISATRLKDEMIKIIAAPQGAETLELMDQWGVLAYIFPQANLKTLLKVWQWKTRCHHHLDKMLLKGAPLIGLAILAGKSLDKLFPLDRREAKIIRLWYQVAHFISDDPHQGPLFKPWLITPQMQIYGLGADLIFLNAAYLSWEDDMIACVLKHIGLNLEVFPLKPSDVYENGWRGASIGGVWRDIYKWWSQQDPRPSRQVCLDECQRLSSANSHIGES